MSNQKKLNSFEKFQLTKFSTVMGKMTPHELYINVGSPKIVCKIAKIEARKNSNSKERIIIERLVDICLIYPDERIVIKGLKPSFIREPLSYSGIEYKYVRHPNYNPLRTPVATAKEYRRAKQNKSYSL